ncbi:tetratricopeptide repeat protein [Ferruginibacter sp.]
MRNKIFLFSTLFVLLAAAGFRYAIKKNAPIPHISKAAAYQNKHVLQCSPDWSLLNVDSLAAGIGVLPGWGNYQWTINSKNDSARFYFNQGINMYYAFHIIESMASFKKAQQFDDKNAMIYWAQALAYGPNINDFEYAATPDAYAAAQTAVSLKENCNAKEKALIDAMAVRYSTDSTISRSILNQRYSDGMKKAYGLFKQDADAGALYADALMLQHPWDYWKHNGNAEPWTPEIIAVLEGILKTHPEHPGANHYYIHTVEASKNPERALPSADRLGKLMPAVAHMIHMPSHIYIRSGNYKEGIKVNEMSVSGYNTYYGLYPAVQNNLPLYLIHNLHMQSACAMMRANYAYSNKSALECRQSFDTSFLSLPQPLGNYIQYLYMTPLFNDVRFGKWDAVLSELAPPAQHIYSTVLWHWARGMAFAGKNELIKATEELNIVQAKMKEPDMLVVMQPFNAPADAAKVAANILAGVIAEQRNNHAKAIQFLTAAVTSEDALIYNEPRDWLLPARVYLGNALLKAGDAAKAEKIFKEDLAENPHNFRALYGLQQALDKQHKDAAAVKKEFEKAFEGADIEAASAF